MNKLFLTIFTFATASFAPMQAMMLSTVRQAARPALPQAQRPVLSVPQRPVAAPAIPTRLLLQPRTFQKPHALQAHAFSTNAHNNAGNYQNSPYFKPEQPTKKSSSWFGYLLGAAAAAGIGYELLQEDEIDKFKRLSKEGSVDISFLEKLTKKANNDVSFREKLTEALCEYPQAFVLLTEQNSGDSSDKAFALSRFLVDLFEYNPDVTEKFTTSITKNSELIKKLLKNVYGIRILTLLVEKNKNAAQKFGEIIITNLTHDELINSIINEIPILYIGLIQKNPQFCQDLAIAITQNSERLTEIAISSSGSYILEKLLERNTQIRTQLITTIAQNPDALNKIARNSNGVRLLEKLMTRDPQAIPAFANTITQNQDTLTQIAVNNNHGIKFLEKLMVQDSQVLNKVTTILEQQPDIFHLIGTDYYGIEFLEKWLALEPQAQDILNAKITQNPQTFVELATSYHGKGKLFLEKWIHIDNRATSTITKVIIKNPIILSQIGENYYDHGRQFLRELVCKNPQMAQQLTESFLAQNLDTIKSTLPLIAHIIPNFKKLLIQKIKDEACNNNDSENSAKMARLFQLCMEMPTQTGQHLQSNFERTLNSNTVNIYIQSKHLNTLYHRVVEKEQQLHHEGYFTFIHGQQRAYYLPEMLYTHLWQIFNNRQLSDFMFAHVKEPATDMQREERKLQKLRQNGRYSNNDQRQRLLFLNYAFFGNDTNLGSNSANFLAYNFNIGGIAISLKDACAHFNCSEIYEQHKQELDTLDQEYKDLSDGGTLLLFGIPDKKVNDVVYLAEPGGYKKSIYIEGIGETYDTQLILETLREHQGKIRDTDRLEFCFIMTQKGGGLDPETGIKVIPFIPGDEQKLQELEQRRKNLFARIKKSIEEKTGRA